MTPSCSTSACEDGRHLVPGGLAPQRARDAGVDPDRARPLERQGASFDAGADDYVAKPFHLEESWPGFARCCAARPVTPSPN